MRRAIVIVVDAMGIGAMPDAPKYRDPLTCNTIANVAKANRGLSLMNFQKLGFGNIDDIQGVPPTEKPLASCGKMNEVSEGKDTTTGHWEMAGIILDKGFKTYPDGFPEELMMKFIKATGCRGILGNYPASGTEIINALGDKHIKTGFPIVYTSADSVFQIAAHVKVIPLEQQYKLCEAARYILDNGNYNVSRVIARPFEGKSGSYTRLSSARKDYSVVPPKPTILDSVVNAGGRVIGIGKIEDIFVKKGITHSMHSAGNSEGLKLTYLAVKGMVAWDRIALDPVKTNSNSTKDFIFVNLVDTDMLYGHRNDPYGYRNALVEIDKYLPEIINSMNQDDLLIITGDHGCDPTMPGTDHSREYVPVIVYTPGISPKNLGTRETFADVAATVAKWLDVPYEGPGMPMID